MSKLKYLIIHCTATPEGREVSPSEIRSWHTDPKPNGRGWRKVGYADMIPLSGKIINLHSYDSDNFISNDEITNGAKGWNGKSRHIVYVGGTDKYGKPKNTLTTIQEFALSNYVWNHVLKYPDIKILGHNQIAQKACPSFFVPDWLECIGIPQKNIFKEKLV